MTFSEITNQELSLEDLVEIIESYKEMKKTGMLHFAVPRHNRVIAYILKEVFNNSIYASTLYEYFLEEYYNRTRIVAG